MTEVFCPRCQSACHPYGRKYDPEGKLPVRYRCLQCKAVCNQDGALLGHHIDGKTCAQVKRLLMLGNSHRAIARTLGLGKATVTKYAQLWKADTECACGKPAGHSGWCAVRLQYSPVRSKWLEEHWHARADTEIGNLTRAAVERAKAKGHTLGPFLWSSASSGASLCWALCTICGKSASVMGPDPLRELLQRNRDRLEGTAFRDECLTPDQRAAQAAEKAEKRVWREAKRTVRALRAHLRASPSPTRASTPEPISSE